MSSELNSNLFAQLLRNVHAVDGLIRLGLPVCFSTPPGRQEDRCVCVCRVFVDRWWKANREAQNFPLDLQFFFSSGAVAAPTVSSRSRQPRPGEEWCPSVWPTQVCLTAQTLHRKFRNPPRWSFRRNSLEADSRHAPAGITCGWSDAANISSEGRKTNKRCNWSGVTWRLQSFYTIGPLQHFGIASLWTDRYRKSEYLQSFHFEKCACAAVCKWREREKGREMQFAFTADVLHFWESPCGFDRTARLQCLTSKTRQQNKLATL